ncbi:MAG: T9SS type A sorting domain-containing protein [Flavobacteriales bacterium]
MLETPTILINGQTNGTATICLDGSISLVATGGNTYSWSPTYGLSNPNIANPIATTNVTHTYTVTGTNEGGCSSEAQFTVNVLPDVTLDVVLDDEVICLGQPVTGQVSGGVSGYTYHIDIDPANIAINNGSGNINWTPTQTGTYTFSATLNGGYPCPLTGDSETIEVVGALPFELSADENPICIGSGTQLHASSAFDLAYTWSPATGLNTTSGSIVIATPMATTTYTVTATSSSGCVSTETIELVVATECCISDMPPPTYSIDAATPDWVGMTYTLDQNLVIQSGVGFEIDNCTLKFAQGKGIILWQGADLKIKNQSLLTVMEICTGHWAGISATHGSVYPFSVDKCNLIIENSTIEHANIAVYFNTLFAVGPLSGTNWSYVKIDNCYFLNNRIDYILQGGVANGTYTPIFGHIVNSVFKTDANFKIGFLPNPTKAVIHNMAKAIPVENCKFINEVTSYLTLFEMTALEYFNAPARIYSYADNAQGINSASQIIGFTRGIRTTSVNGISASIYLRGTDIACWRDVYVRSSGTHTFKDNDFYNLTADMITSNMFINGSLNYINSESGDVIGISPYGLYIDGAGSIYTVIDNYFKTSIQLPGWTQGWAHGMIANNTGDFANRIRRNTFEYMQRALKIQGDNRTTNKNDGLKYSCNTFINNLSDIRELNSNNGNPGSFGVPHQLSVQTNGGTTWAADPNNNFTQSSSSCNLCGNDDVSNTFTSGTTNHRYVRLINSTNPHDDETTDFPKIEIIDASGASDNCVADIQLIGGTGTSLMNQKTVAEANYESLLETYEDVLDGGNTTALLYEIESTNYGQALQLYYDLMAQSPNLSEEALVAALQRFDLPAVLLTQLLASNPHAAGSSAVQTEMEMGNVSFEEYQLAMINQGLSTFSSLDAMQLAMSAYITVRGDALAQLMRNIDEDDNISDKASAKMALLDVNNYYTDLLLKIELLVETGDYVGAQLLTTQAESDFRLTASDESDLENYYELLAMEEALHGMEQPVLQQHEVNALELMVENTSAVVSTRALNMLIQFGHVYNEPIMIDEGGLRNVLFDSKETNDKVLRLYPNPAIDFITIEYTPAGVSRIELYDLVGKLVITQNTQLMAVQHLIDTHSLPHSIYELKLLGVGGEILTTTSFIKNK